MEEEKKKLRGMWVKTARNEKAALFIGSSTLVRRGVVLTERFTFEDNGDQS